eukprot:scaffold11020_cov66-Cyclotella_meneghiniana.AAC.5
MPRPQRERKQFLLFHLAQSLIRDSACALYLFESSVETTTANHVGCTNQSHTKRTIGPKRGGYIEEALKCYNHNIERTLDALLSGNNTIHPGFIHSTQEFNLNIKRFTGNNAAQISIWHRGATFKDDGNEHVDRQKQCIKKKRNVRQRKKLITSTITTDDFGITGNEYNDDYDDQYDGVGDDGGMAGGIGGLDEGLYDVHVHNVHQRYDRGGAKNDQDMWRQYNKLIKEVDNESQYWEESHNLNRQNNHKPNNKEQSKEDMYDDDDGDENTVVQTKGEEVD